VLLVAQKTAQEASLPTAFNLFLMVVTVVFMRLMFVTNTHILRTPLLQAEWQLLATIQGAVLPLVITHAAYLRLEVRTEKLLLALVAEQLHAINTLTPTAPQQLAVLVQHRLKLVHAKEGERPLGTGQEGFLL